jgi:predicted O-methyltransferase YrrM
MSRKSELGIKTSVTRREGDELARLATGNLVVEVGSLLGYSTIKMAQVARRVVAVDPHIDYPSYRPAPTLREFMSNIYRHSVYSRVTPMLSVAQIALPLLGRSDMAFIDATGEYDLTKYCLEHVNSPVIACHDYGRRSCAGATRAIDEFVRKNNKRCRVIDTLAVIT